MAESYRFGFRSLWRLLLPIFCLSFLVADPATATASSDSGRDAPSIEQVQERIQALKDSGSIDEELRKQLLDLYQVALERLNAAAAYAASAQEMERLVQEAPERIQQLQQQAQHVELPVPLARELRDADLKQIQQVQAQEKAVLAGLQNQLNELEEQLRQTQARPDRAREELAAAKQRRQEIEKNLQAAPASGENERLRQARTVAQQAARLAISNQIRALEQELLSNDARVAILGAQRTLLRQQLEAQAQRVRELDELANERTLSEAALSAQQAAEAAVGAQPVVQQAARVNAELSKQLARLVTDLERSANELQRLQQQLEQLQARYRTTEQQLEIAGLNQALGDVLRRERLSMQSVSQVARRMDERQQRIAELRLRKFQIEQQSQAAAPIDRQVVELMAEHEVEADPAQKQQIAQRLQQLLTDRNDLLQKITINYSRYANQLLELNRLEQQLAAQTLAYRDLLDESLFWIASGNPIDRQWLRNLSASMSWLLRPDNWAATATVLVRQLAGAPALILLVAPLALLAGGRPYLRRRLERTTLPVGTQEDHILHTFLALWYTLLLTLLWPLLLGGLGLLLSRGASEGSFAAAVGASLRSTAMVVLVIEGFRQLCRERGVAQTHFRWRHSSRRRLRRHLAWLLAVAVPVSFAITLTETQPEEVYRDGLGRLAFVVGSTALATFAWILLRPRFQLSRSDSRERRRGWWRLRRAIRIPATLLPLALAALSLYGYHYTALQLESRLITTGWLLVSLMIAGNLALRWLRLAEKRLQSMRASPARSAGRGRPDPELVSADEQARTILTLLFTGVTIVGLWFIWSDLLPAFNVLEGIVLWESAGADESLIQVTLGDLALALLVLALTLVAAHNLPGVLEIAVLHRLAIDSGNRYAITTISRYLIVAIGLLMAISWLGVRWSQAQWLVAALGVGLGFGLQEIFANFVSGLILLFERPIRVGDAVTVNDMSGRVTRIQIRATTITDWDRRELIIPNKTFITDRLINWTLTDSVTRVKVALRCPFDCPPEEVRQLLLECAHRHPRVMRDPEPFAYVVGLGDSAFEFELYVFVRELADRLQTRHELYVMALERLAERGIRVPYPQLDVHLQEPPPRPQQPAP